MKYLKKFENHTEYEGALATLDLPNVSVCVEENEVHYTPYTPDPANGYEYVEIAGIKWATKNVGAASETDAGLYFLWGDTQGYTASQVGIDKQFSWEDYKYSNYGGSTAADMTKYNSTDGKTVLDLEDDAAHVNMGGNWRMPTKDEFNTLLTATGVTKTWITVDGVIGYSFTENDKTLFLPAVGYCDRDFVGNVGSRGYYYSSSLDTSNVVRSLHLFLDFNPFMNNGSRTEGLPVRAVLDLGE